MGIFKGPPSRQVLDRHIPSVPNEVLGQTRHETEVVVMGKGRFLRLNRRGTYARRQQNKNQVSDFFHFKASLKSENAIHSGELSLGF